MKNKTNRGRAKSNRKPQVRKRQSFSQKNSSRTYNEGRNKVQANRNKKKKSNKKIVLTLIIIVGMFWAGSYFYSNYTEEVKVVKRYYELLELEKYEEMYELVECDYTRDEFINRLTNIYNGIEANNISTKILTNMIFKNIGKKSDEKNNISISYRVSMDTIAGNVSFFGSAPVERVEGKYKIKWNSSMIFQNLKNNEKVRVRTLNCKRGTIYDRNGKALAKDASIYEIGIVPSKFNKQDAKKVSELLEINYNEVIRDLNEYSDQDSDYIFIKKISKEEQDIKNELLKIKGILIGDSAARVYPYKEVTSTMTGYVKDGEGKAGLEESYDSELKGNKGYEIYIETDGKIKEVIAKKEPVDGIDIKTTIDINIQKKIYDEFEEETGLVVSINYNTGEVLALVSVPTYDANRFVLGISNDEWDELQNDIDKPMFNRYLATYTPGSTIKPIMGAIGLENDVLNDLEEPSRTVKKWQKDSSWKDFYITTLELYSEPVNLENALVYSDNIYFAKLALELGKNKIEKELNDLGFNSELDFEQRVTESTYGKLDNEKTIATTGFGQANVMVNPILMASIYSAFANSGDMVKPYLTFEENEENRTKIYKENIISDEISNDIKEYMIEVVKRGSGQKCFLEDKVIAGKTGTAEIKKDQNDKTGTENGWFNSFDEYGNLYVCMVENVKNKGGSAYVVEKMRNIYE